MAELIVLLQEVVEEQRTAASYYKRAERDLSEALHHSKEAENRLKRIMLTTMGIEVEVRSA